MVLQSFGITKDIDSLKSELAYTEAGTNAYDNGCLLLANDLKVKAITAHPKLFPPDTISTVHSNTDLLSVLETAKQKDEKDTSSIDSIRNFIEKGGEVLLEIPRLEHVQNAIDNGQVVIALVYACALGSNEGGYHFVVVNGYDEDRVFITNPLQDSKRQEWFQAKHFLFALHSSTMVDLDNGTLLVVGR